MANMLKTAPFHTFLALFSHPFTTFTTRIAEQSSLPVSARLLHLLECTALFLVLLRLASLAIQIYTGCHLPWDPFIPYLASHLHLYDGYLLACIVCVVLYNFTLNCQLFLGKKQTNEGKGSISWQCVVYDLIVRNAEQASKCHRALQKSSLGLNQTNRKLAFLSLLYTTIHDDLTQKHLDLVKLGQPRHQLAIFPFLSVQTRKKCLQFQAFSNCIAHLLPCIILLVPLLGVTFQLVLIVAATPGGLPPFAWLLLLSDLTLLWIVSFAFYRNILLLIYFGMIISLATRWHLQAAHHLLAYLKAKYRSRPLQSLNPWNRLLLRNFLTEHAQLCALLDASNGQFISLAAFTTCLLNAPTNIYLVYRLVYRPILLLEFTAILILINAQFLCYSSAFVPAAWANGAVYQTGKYLPAVQLYVLRGGNNRSLKIKYEILQSTLTESRVKSGLSIGSLCLITFESLYKVVSLYAVYMLVFFDLLPK